MSAQVIISGAGIAGPALAHELCARGWRSTVIERYPERRDEGHNVDIRGAGREVVQRMGIEDDIRAANTGEVGTRILRMDGSAAAVFPVAAGGTGAGPTAELEILRGELSRILIGRTAAHTDYRFNTQITDVTDHGDHINVALDDGTALTADLLVIAEGLNSRSRRLVTSTEVENLGMHLAYVTLPRTEHDNHWWNWQHLTGSRAVHLRPDNLGTTRATLSFLSDLRGFENLDRTGQLTILGATFADAGAPLPRILRALEDGAPMYMTGTGTLRNPLWSNGRIALLGDAAFSNATFGGVGTSLALIGAYILAGELATSVDVHLALTRYQDAMRPFTDSAPNVSARALRIAHPKTRNGIRALHAGAALMAGPVGSALTSISGKGLIHGGTAHAGLPHYARDPAPADDAGS